MIIVSKCLLGYNCKYNGKNNYSKKVIEYLKDKQYIAVCPEELGGLPTPRIPSERKEDKVINRIGEDKTINFIQGANKALEIISPYTIDSAILKAKSPTCGKGLIYDGSFGSRLIKGNGVFAEKLLEKNITIENENSMFE